MPDPKGTFVKDLPDFSSPTYSYKFVLTNGTTMTGLVSITNIKKVLNYTSVIGTPTIAGVAATTKTVTGSDVAHQIALNTSVSPAPGATIATVTFGQTYAVAPTVVCYPANAGAMDLSLQGVFMTSNGSLTTYIIVAGPGGFNGGVLCKWNVHVLI